MEKVLDDERQSTGRRTQRGARGGGGGRENSAKSSRSLNREKQKVSWAPPAASDNPMREYRPSYEEALNVSASSAASSQRSRWEGHGYDGRRESPAKEQLEDGSGSFFDPWAPEGVYARRRREEASQSSRGQGSRRIPPTEGPRIEDTQIGTGISEFLKRGVAQAAQKPVKERPEMLPSKDGGFIATIQQGFQGIFGHLASSKEEVLKMRGPMSALEYEAVPGDDIDQQVQHFARQIPEHLGEWLTIYRKARGEYEVSDEVVRMAWQSTVSKPTPQHPDGQILREVFVYVESEAEGATPGEPLHLFLRHSANVAYDLHFGSAMMKVPEGSRLSFAEETGTLLKDSDADSKYKAMLLASEQAQKREEAALQFRRMMDDEADERHSSGVTRMVSAPPEPPRKEAPPPPNPRAAVDKPILTPPRGFDGILDVGPLPGLPPLPPLLPPELPGPGGSFLLPPGAELDGKSFLLPSKAGYMGGPGLQGLAAPTLLHSPFATPGSSTNVPAGPGGSFVGVGLGGPGSFYGAGLPPANGGSFLGVGGSFLMTTGMQPEWGSLPRTGSNVQVGLPPMTMPLVR